MQLNIFNSEKQIRDSRIAKKKPQPIKEEASRDVDKDWKLYHSLIKSFSGF
jgi:hypothetical protein